MRRVWAVIRREYLQRVRSRWFVFATAGVPLLLVAATAVPVVLASRNEAADRTIVVLDLSGDVGPWVARALEKGGYVVEPASAVDEERVRRRVESGEVGGYLVVDRESLVAGYARLVVNESPSALRQLSIRQAVIQAPSRISSSARERTWSRCLPGERWR
jgi:ABC-2 type transport system permease protein